MQKSRVPREHIPLPQPALQPLPAHITSLDSVLHSPRNISQPRRPHSLKLNHIYPAATMPISKKDRVRSHPPLPSPPSPLPSSLAGAKIRLPTVLSLIKTQINREHKKADAAGTRAPVKANGNPVKAPTPMSKVWPPSPPFFFATRVELMFGWNMAVGKGGATVLMFGVHSARFARRRLWLRTRRRRRCMRRRMIRRCGRRRSAGLMILLLEGGMGEGGGSGGGREGFL